MQPSPCGSHFGRPRQACSQQVARIHNASALHSLSGSHASAAPSPSSSHVSQALETRSIPQCTRTARQRFSSVAVAASASSSSSASVPPQLPPPPPRIQIHWESVPGTAGPLGPGDAVLHPGPAVSLALQQPEYRVTVVYDAAGRPLAGAQRVIAHLGHSGWRDTADVEMTRLDPSAAAATGSGSGEGSGGGSGNGAISGGGELWTCSYPVPAGLLPNFSHLEVCEWV